MMSEEELYQNRDRLLGEIHQMCKSTAAWCEKHDQKDDERFKAVNRNFIYVAIAVLTVAFATGVLGQLLGKINIGV